MSDNYYSEVNENGVVTPLRDLAAFPRSEQAVLGAKNWLINEAVTTEHNGVTFTVNADKTITMNGTATGGDAYLRITASLTSLLRSGISYILSGCTGGSASTYMLYSGNAGQWDAPNGDAVKTYDGSFNSIYLVVKNGVTVENVIVYPMIRLASNPNNTFVPFAGSNEYLTNNKVDKLALKINNVDLDDVIKSGYYFLNGNITNSPKQYGFLHVIGASSTQVLQFLTSDGKTNNELFMRKKESSGWGSWYKFTGTEVS